MAEHGRLIDADALKESIRCSDADEPKVLSPKKLHKVLTEWIDKRPTIEERKTGKWEMLQISINPPVYKCSVCGRHALQTLTGCLLDRHFESNLTKYCPNCGAEMKEGDSE